jgi:hypothetical protein
VEALARRGQDAVEFDVFYAKKEFNEKKRALK